MAIEWTQERRDAMSARVKAAHAAKKAAEAKATKKAQGTVVDAKAALARAKAKSPVTVIVNGRAQQYGSTHEAMIALAKSA